MNMERDVRNEYLAASALAFTVDMLSSLPVEQRPQSNIDEMKRMFESLLPEAKSAAELDVQRWLSRFPRVPK
jgi:hypothetical protein